MRFRSVTLAVLLHSILPLSLAHAALPPSAVLTGPANVPLASTVAPKSAAPTIPKLADRLKKVRVQANGLEKQIFENLKSRKEGQQNLAKIRALIQLQNQERILTKKRLAELNTTVSELEIRRAVLVDKVHQQRMHTRRYIRILEYAGRNEGAGLSAARGIFGLSESDRLDAPKRKALSSLVQMSVRELETLKIDLQDSHALEQVIQQEKNQLAFLTQDLEEQQGVMELNRQLQAESLRKTSEERLAQLENYRKLKESESQVETLIEQFNARKELEHSIETERASARQTAQLLHGPILFERIKGKLPLPMESAKVVSAFGKGFDPKSRLMVFRKGIEIAGGATSAVRAVFAGRIAYAGELPEYGKVAIVDHGDHYFSLCAFLGNLTKKVGENVQAGELVGWSSSDGKPVYFEIRSRNVPVNPLQWVSASFTLNE